MIHSPWKRAVQTAELLEVITKHQRESTLLAQPPSDALLEEIAALKVDRVALVGHEPWMGELLSLLLLGDVAKGPRFPFKKGGVAIAEGEPAPGGCDLIAMWTPRSLRAAAGS